MLPASTLPPAPPPAAPAGGGTALRSLALRSLSAEQAGALPAAGILVLRVGTGVPVAWLHGLHKVQDGIAYLDAARPWPLVADVAALGFPAPVLFAALASASQLLGGILLVAGLLTRWAAAGVAASMAAAVWLNLAGGGPDAQLAGLYGVAAAALALLGGGRYSLDRLWTRHAGP